MSKDMFDMTSEERLKHLKEHKRDVTARVDALKDNADAVFMAKTLQKLDDIAYDLSQVRDVMKSTKESDLQDWDNGTAIFRTMALAIDSLADQLMFLITDSNDDNHCLDVAWELADMEDELLIQH